MNPVLGQFAKPGPPIQTNTCLATPASMPGFIAPAIVCDGVLTMPPTPSDSVHNQNTNNLFQQNITHLPHPSFGFLLEPSNMHSPRNSILGSQQLTGVSHSSSFYSPNFTMSDFRYLKKNGKMNLSFLIHEI